MEFDREAGRKPEVGVQIGETTATYRQVVIMAYPRISLVNFVTHKIPFGKLLKFIQGKGLLC